MNKKIAIPNHQQIGKHSSLVFSTVIFKTLNQYY